jgi:PAS domain S-box-containing protein
MGESLMARIAIHAEPALAAGSLRQELEQAGYEVLIGRPPAICAREAIVALVSMAADGPDAATWTAEARAVRASMPIIWILKEGDSPSAALDCGATDILRDPIAPGLARARIEGHIRAAAVHRDVVLARAREMEAVARAAQFKSELAESLDFLNGLLDLLPSPVVVADLRGRLLTFNRSAQTVLGYGEQEALEDLHVTDLYGNPDDARRVMEAIRSSEHLRVEQVKVRLRSRRGEQIPVQLWGFQLHNGNGQAIATCGLFRDIRETESLSVRLQRATGQLIDSEKRAAAIEVAGAAAHELNQPLTSVMGLLEMIQLRGDLDKETDVRLDRAYGQLERMAEIVRELADVTSYKTTPYVHGVDILDLSPLGSR